MNKLFPLLILCLLALTGYGQQPSGDLKVSLQQAIDLGLKNRYDIQSGQYNLHIAENEISKSKKEWIPEVSGTGNVRYSPQIQATFIPAGFFGNEPGLVALGANSTSVFGLELNQPIFKPGINSDIKIARNNLDLEKEKYKRDQNEIKAQIAQAYLNVMLKELQHKITLGDEQRYKEYELVAENRLRLGTLLENDYLKAKLDYENAKAETLKASQNYQLALDNMKYQINAPAESKLLLSDSLNSVHVLFDQIPTSYEAANRSEIEQLKIQQQINVLQLSKSKQNALPSLSFYANYSQQFSYTNFDYSLNQWWSPFSYLGLRLNVPITSNFKNKNTIQHHQIISVQTDLNLKQKQADVNYEIQKASSELSNALQNMNTAKNNYDLSRTIYENQKQQYDLGALLYSNLLDTDRSLNTTEQNYIKAVYEYLVASISYQKAIGNY